MVGRVNLDWMTRKSLWGNGIWGETWIIRIQPCMMICLWHWLGRGNNKYKDFEAGRSWGYSQNTECSDLELTEGGENDRRKVHVGRSFHRAYLAMANSIDFILST